MNQGARDANHAMDVARAYRQRQDIDARLKRIEALLVQLVNNTAKDGSQFVSLRDVDSE